MDKSQKKSFKKFLDNEKQTPFYYLLLTDDNIKRKIKEVGEELKDEDEKDKEAKESLLKYMLYVNQGQ